MQIYGKHKTPIRARTTSSPGRFSLTLEKSTLGTRLAHEKLAGLSRNESQARSLSGISRNGPLVHFNRKLSLHFYSSLLHQNYQTHRPVHSSKLKSCHSLVLCSNDVQQ